MKKSVKFGKHSLENYQHRDRFGEWLGYQVKRVLPKERRAITELKIRKDHLSPAGRVHGGAISAFFDFASGAAVFTTLGPRDFCSTVELKVHYFKPLNLGDLLRADTKVVHRGKRLCTVQGFIFREGEKDSVAMCSATFNVVARD